MSNNDTECELAAWELLAETEGSGASPCSLCEGMGVLDGFGGGNRTECHKCNGKGKANKLTPRPKLCENKSK